MAMRTTTTLSTICTNTAHFSRPRSTGKERDTESGLDYFGARYYGSSMGRFLSSDPFLNSGHPDDPQTWNRYTYGLNNPLRIVDPTGLYNLVNTCASGDDKCNKQFAQNAANLKAGLAVDHRRGRLSHARTGARQPSLPGDLRAL